MRAPLALLALFPAVAAAVEPGNWELSLSTMMTGLDKPAQQVTKRCFTDADARDPSRMLGTGAGCTFTNKNDSGGVFTFAIVCGGVLPLQGTGVVRHSAQSFEADLDLFTEDRRFATRTHMKGRRLGSC